MKTTGELFVTFLLNACWQVMLVAAVAALGDLLLRRTNARYRHWLWVAALGLSLFLPIITSVMTFARSATPGTEPREIAAATIELGDFNTANAPAIGGASSSAFQIGSPAAIGLIAVYLALLCFRAFRLSRAWARTRAAKRDTIPFDPAHRIHAIVAKCHRTIGVEKITTASSVSLSAPATVGVFRPLIILPEALARGASDEELTAAIGHELVHVRRRDYLLNLIYEFILLPLSFHPAAALVRRRITQTRELRCDELVTELLLCPEVYARSLVQLARSAMPLVRRARTVAVGIADADILEVRVMSLLKRTKVNVTRKRLLLVAAAILLVIPCAVATAFPFHFNIDPARAQEPSSEAQEKKELRARREREIKEKMLRQEEELKEGIEKETNPEVKARLKEKLQQLREQKSEITVLEDGKEPYTVRLVPEARAREGRERERKRQALLTQMTRISMDQAIQIASSQTPGKVFECSLVGERWEGPEELAKPSLVLYHVVILSGDDAKPTTTHVLVNAVDGTIFRTSQEDLIRRE
jgi:beta-lactamase regulating signal transducer with metallopeptidase domain/uncharacterized membrane protein YkoI